MKKALLLYPLPSLHSHQVEILVPELDEIVGLWNLDPLFLREAGTRGNRTKFGRGLELNML
jgi:hypothetical protein